MSTPSRAPAPDLSPGNPSGDGAGGNGGLGLSAVRCAGLTYRFGDNIAVDHVDLEIAPGETFGLLGPNGAGKTTTIRMLTTLLKPAAGSVTVFGTDANSNPMRVRRMIGYVPQLLSADATLTGRENVELYARLFDVPSRLRGERVEGALASGHGASAKTCWRITATTASFPEAVRENEEVVPVNVSTWVLPSGATGGR